MANLCKHSRLPEIDFDEKLAVRMTPLEVRKRWPRQANRCPDCNVLVLQYASMAHMLMGGWG